LIARYPVAAAHSPTSSSGFSLDSYAAAAAAADAHEPTSRAPPLKLEPTTFNSLNKVNAVALTAATGSGGALPHRTTVSIGHSGLGHHLSPSSSDSGSVSPPSYASLTSTYASLVKAEPLFIGNPMSIGIDT
jgi:hypothetical protein